MSRIKNTYLYLSIFSIGLNFLFLHYLSTLNNITSTSTICETSELKMHITPLDTPLLSNIVDNYIQQKMIFVLGSMSSGTTLTRLILDTHPEVNCGDETKIVELLLSFISKTINDKYFMKFMANAGTKNITIEKATALFIYYVMENNFKSKNFTTLQGVKYLCNKEPMNTYYFHYLHQIFPNARFVYVIRDGRDMTYSYMRRNRIPMTFSEFYKNLNNWNNANTIGIKKCEMYGKHYCQLVKYENLVNEPEKSIREMTSFLGLKFLDDMLHFENFVGEDKLALTKVAFIKNGIRLNGINNQSIGSWKNKIQDYDEKQIEKSISLLKTLKYL